MDGDVRVRTEAAWEHPEEAIVSQPLPVFAKWEWAAQCHFIFFCPRELRNSTFVQLWCQEFKCWQLVWYLESSGEQPTVCGLLEFRLESQLWDNGKVTSLSQPSFSHLQNGHSVTHFLRRLTEGNEWV